MKTARIFSLAFLILIFAFSTLLFAGVPQMINYQGKITTPAGALVDTTVQMIFTIYDDSATGTVLWADTQSTVVVEKGIFSVLLGSVNPIPDSVFPGDIRYLGVKVGADPEMTPRKSIVSVGYAYKAEYADTAQYAQVAVSDGDWEPDTSGFNIYRLTGNVGIGTPAPQEKLHIVGGYQSTRIKIENSASGGKTFMLRTGVDPGGGFGISDQTALTEPFFIESGATTNLMYLKGNNVGIGTTSPESKLHLYSNSGTDQFIVGGSVSEGRAVIGYDHTNNRLKLVTYKSGYGNITIPEGNVGIGTISPAHKLHVAGSVAIDDTLFTNTVSSRSPLRLQTEGTTRMYIDDISGDVGIGTTNPASRLYVKGGNAILTVDNTAPNTDIGIYLRESGGAHMGKFWYDGSESLLKIETFPEDRDIYINPGDGGVGIGTTAPTATLDVFGDARIRNLPFGGGIPVVDGGGGRLFRQASSRRYKENIRVLRVDPDNIFQLTPVRFNWKTTEQGDIGLIAEDVDEVIPDLVIYDSDGKPDAVKYDKVAIYLLEVVKTQQKRISALEQQIAELER